MYSRNTSRRGAFPFQRERPRYSEKPADEGDAFSPVRESVPSDGADENVTSTARKMPDAPPNYRGMIYEMGELYDGKFDSDETAEGIGRLVENDASYGEFSKRLRKRDYLNGEKPQMKFVRTETGENTPSPDSQKTQVEAKNGLQKLVDGLQNKGFLPEDVLVCAMIILMLNGNSEDDVLMALVLMMLL